MENEKLNLNMDFLEQKQNNVSNDITCSKCSKVFLKGGKFCQGCGSAISKTGKQSTQSVKGKVETKSRNLPRFSKSFIYGLVTGIGGAILIIVAFLFGVYSN